MSEAQTTLLLDNEQAPSVNLEQVSSILGISQATARNWIKSGQLSTKTLNGGISFDLEHIDEVHRKLTAGEIERLQKRANKRKSTSTFIPEEYAPTKETAGAIADLIARYHSGGYELRPFLFAVAMQLPGNQATRKSVQLELGWWRHQVNGDALTLGIELHFRNWIAVWRDVIKYWVLSSNEVASNKNYSKGQHRGNVGEGQLHVRDDNIAEFAAYEIKPNKLKDAILAAYDRQVAGR